MKRKLLKYIISILLIAILIFVFFSCGKTNAKSGKQVTLTYKINSTDICVTLPDEEAEKVIAIMDGNTYSTDFLGFPSCGFDKNVSLKIGNRIYAIAGDSCNTVVNWRTGRYFYIAQEDMEYIHELFQKYGADFPWI